MRGKKVLLLVILSVAFSYVQAEPKGTKVIEGIVTAVLPPEIGSPEATFTLKGVKGIFEVNRDSCSEANFIAVDNKVRISFEETKGKVIRCKSFEIIEMMDVEGGNLQRSKKSKNIHSF